MSRQQKFQEHKLWTCGFDFAQALSEAYLLWIRQHQKNGSSSSAIRKQIPVLVARALRAIAMQVKLSHGQGGRDAENAMLLSGQPDGNAEIGVVMRAGRYNPNSPVEVAGRKNSCRLTPARMVDAGDDFDWAVYTISRQLS